MFISQHPYEMSAAFDHAGNTGNYNELRGLFYEVAIRRTLSGSIASGVALSRELRATLDGNPHMKGSSRFSIVAGDSAPIVVELQLQIDGLNGQRVTAEGTVTNVLRRGHDSAWRFVLANARGIVN